MKKKDRQLSLMDAVLSYSRRKKTSKAVATLSEIDKLVNWQALVGLVKGLDKTQGGKGGRPPICLFASPAAWVTCQRKPYNRLIKSSSGRTGGRFG